jgi:ferric-dicitrate binding protein FerR (iron transport regulator)
MTKRDCRAIEALIDREVQGLSDAERLRMEEHVSECRECREALYLARIVRDALASAPSRLSDSARERSLARAFARTDAIDVKSAQKSRLTMYVGSGLAVAAAALLAFAALEHETAPAPVAMAPQTGAVAPNSAPLAPKVEPAWIEAEKPEERTFAHADVRLKKGARVRFDDSKSTLLVDRGQVDVNVDPSQHRAFAVTTQHFRVQVLGTQFSVTPESVHVQKGRVQVFALDGSVLAKDLGAGASFSYGAEEAEASSEESAEQAASKPDASAPKLSAASWLARAREALAHGDTKSARNYIDRAEHSDPKRNDRAEAGTLRAESALLDRDARGAEQHYLSVAKSFANLPAGENAAFAAAQLAARTDPARERTLYQHYLKRYPHGRFADEAQKRLQSLH